MTQINSKKTTQKTIQTLVKISGVFLIAMILNSCSKNSTRYGIDPAPEKKAAALVQDSFQVSPAQTTTATDTAHVVIARSALEKEFLLTTNMMSQLPTPMFTSLQSHVVYFTLKDNHIYMLDSTVGKAIGENNTQAFLPLAEFDILSQSADDITIDFNLGMKKIITVSDMSSSDNTEPAGKPAAINFSFLQEVKFENNQFFIRQIVQAQTETLMPLEIRYYLAPYNPDPEFVPTRSPATFDHVGYFEANPILDVHGNTIRYAMKFNQKKPITFAISANTPEEYKETVRNGILYWNKSLGDNKIQVIDLTDKNLTAPNPNYNIVQWTDWDTAGYAYADAHVDPRSGEVTHAQVFFPSAFTHAAVEKRVRVLEGSRAQFGLTGFHPVQLCRRNIAKEFSNSLAVTENSATITKAAMKKAVKDYVYEVIAHEVGHVLGLRHNFAGNLAANYDASERRALALSYYQNMKAPAGIVSSSSVMEYSRFEESSWNGDKLQNGFLALTHDYMTINYLYNNNEIPNDAPLFCTDSQIDTYADCNMSDASRSVVSYTVGNYRFGIETLPARVLNQFITESKVTDSPGQPLKPVKNVLLKPETFALGLATDRYKFLSLLKEEVRLIQVRGPLQPIWPSQQPKILSLEKDFIASEVNRIGGLGSIVNLAEKDLAAQWIRQFAELIADNKYSEGEVGNSKYSFSNTEKELMQQQFNIFAVSVQNILIKHNLKALTAESVLFQDTYGQSLAVQSLGWFSHPLTDELAPLIQSVSNHYIFSKEKNKYTAPVVSKDGLINNLELPIYTYTQDIRKTAASMLSAPHVAIDWGYLEKPMNAGQMKTELEILGETDKIDFTKTDKLVLRWLLQNQEIQNTLNL